MSPGAPRRVLHLIDTGGPGGAETVYLELATGLDDRAWINTAVVPERDWLDAALKGRGLEPIELSGDGAFDVGYLRRLDRLVRSERADIIQTHLLGTAVYGSLVARLRGLPLVATFHGRADVPPTERFRRSKLGILKRPGSRFVFVSHALRRWFVETHGLPVDQCRVVHNGIDLSRFSTSRSQRFRERIGVAQDRVLVAAIGNLRGPKRYDVFLRAAAIVAERWPAAFHFVVVGEGEGPLKKELSDLRDRLGLGDCVTFTGFVGDVRTVLEATDIYCLTSSFEGFSLSTLEAVASGVPVVATRCGGPEEIVEDGRSGVLVPAESPKAIAEALGRVVGSLRGPGSPATTEHVRRGDVLRFSIREMTTGYSAVYEELLRDGEGPG